MKDLEKKRGRVAVALNRGKHLTPSVLESLLQAETFEDLEELWTPYKLKRKTRAQVAKSQGLEPLAALVEDVAKAHVSHFSSLKSHVTTIGSQTFKIFKIFMLCSYVLLCIYICVMYYRF